ncbi:helix-turn-helix domain-containing protein [Scatolibacter rhodanostii]|uniref:helix-turn-helix domain-containing protein n=1 Tax=Scatolibacter rhodanostii TaxID=2014781 RepID=UPI001356695F|nr:helix-turn-helix transcriptional regulator [Scatolibacter rhodanostii]
MTPLGEKIRSKRMNQNMTQKILSEKSGISLKMLRNYELGRNEPGAAALSWLALTLGVSADWLLGIEVHQHHAEHSPKLLTK